MTKFIQINEINPDGGADSKMLLNAADISRVYTRNGITHVVVSRYSVEDPVMLVTMVRESYADLLSLLSNGRVKK